MWESHRDADTKELADHHDLAWVRLVQEAGSEEYRKQRKALQAENRKARQQLLEAEAALVQEQGVVAELQHLLALAERRVDTPPKENCGTQVSGCGHRIIKMVGCNARHLEGAHRGSVSIEEITHKPSPVPAGLSLQLKVRVLYCLLVW